MRRGEVLGREFTASISLGFSWWVSPSTTTRWILIAEDFFFARKVKGQRKLVFDEGFAYENESRSYEVHSRKDI
jgi:hypothetical protein